VGEAFSHEIRVRYAECDAQGCVFNANYLTYFDVTMTEFWRAVFAPYQEMVDSGTDMVVAEARVRYLAPVLFDELITVEARIARLGTTSTTTALTVLRDGKPAAEGELRHVYVRTGTAETIPVPDDLRRALEPFVADHPG
jgi:acyl-CoA thioester hydrolase